jgi:hypothetical protein
MKTELFVVASTWAVAAGIVQVMLWPFNAANWVLWFGLVIGATAQAAIYQHRQKYHVRFGTAKQMKPRTFSDTE